MESKSKQTGRITAHWFCAVSLWLIALASVSCSGSEEERQEALRPYCEHSSVQVNVGETVTNRVFNTSAVEVVSVPGIVSVCVDGTVISVTGLNPGEGSILLVADGQRLHCPVTVIKVRPDEPEPETPDEIAAQLADATLRFCIGGRKLEYTSAGTLFSLHNDGTGIFACSLVTGESMELRLDKPLGTLAVQLREKSVIRNAVSGFSGVPLSELTLELNGNAAPLRYAEMACPESGGVWFHLVTAEGEPVWVVVPAGF